MDKNYNLVEEFEKIKRALASLRYGKRTKAQIEECIADLHVIALEVNHAMTNKRYTWNELKHNFQQRKAG